MTTILEALDDPNLLRPVFRDPATWRAWRVVLKATFGLAMEPAERELFSALTGRRTPPAAPAREVWWIKGRRAGGSFTAALVAVYLATFRDYRDHLAPGERATVMVLAADKRQARTILRYVVGIFEAVPILRRRVERELAESVDLRNGVTIEVHANSFRSVRGYTVVAAVLDEVAFWRDETSANPDVEVLKAIRPALATIPNSLLIGLSSPYRRTGALWDAYRRHYGRDDDSVLVVKADTRTLNPTVPEEVVAKAYEDDPAAAAAEYGAEFRTDLETFLDEELLQSLVEAGVRERPPVRDAAYRAFADPSGGRGDAFTLAIAHKDDGAAILDVVRARRPPFDPSEVVREYAALLGEYGLSEVTGDRYAGAWVEEAFRAEGISYRAASLTKSELYLETLPLFTRGSVRLVDDPALLTELARLERRTSRSGRDTVDHPPGAHDDRANAAAGALWLAVNDAPVEFSPEHFVVGGVPAALSDPTSPWADEHPDTPPWPY